MEIFRVWSSWWSSLRIECSRRDIGNGAHNWAWTRFFVCVQSSNTWSYFTHSVWSVKKSLGFVRSNLAVFCLAWYRTAKFLNCPTSVHCQSMLELLGHELQSIHSTIRLVSKKTMGLAAMATALGQSHCRDKNSIEQRVSLKIYLHHQIV